MVPRWTKPGTVRIEIACENREIQVRVDHLLSLIPPPSQKFLQDLALFAFHSVLRFLYEMTTELPSPSRPPPENDDDGKLLHFLEYHKLKNADETLPPEVATALEQFRTFIRTQQIKYPDFWLHKNCEVIWQPGSGFGIGLRSIEGLHKGKPLASIPKNIVLCMHTVSEPNWRKVFETYGKHMHGMIAIAFAYVLESARGDESPFAGYLKCFSLPDVPRLWEDDEKEILRGTECDRGLGLSLVSPPPSR